MKKEINPLNSMGEEFWKKHFKVFGFIKIFFSMFIDFLEDKMKSPELAMIMAGYYLIGINTKLLGIYQAMALCQPLYPNSHRVSDFLLLEKSSFSMYSHYYYPLLFIGNLNRSPYYLSLVCAIFSMYDFILNLIDVKFI